MPGRIGRLPRASEVPRVAAAGVFALGTLVAAAYSRLAAPNLLPVSDANGYRLLGRHLADGIGYVRPYDLLLADVVRPTAEFPPGFPALLAALDLVGVRSVGGQRLALAVVAGLVALGALHVARRLLPTRSAVAVGLVAAVHPALFQPGAALLAESLHALAVVALLLAVLRAEEVPTPSRVAAVGLVGGAAALVRSEALLLAVLLAVPVVVLARRDRVGDDGSDGRSGARALLAAALAGGLVLAPGAWAVRNLTTFQEPVLSSNNLGSVLSGANCDATWGGDLVGYWFISDDCFPGFTQERLAEVDESVVAVELRDDGLRHLRDNLDRFPAVAAVRVLRTFQLWEPEQQARLSTFEGRRLLTERITGWLTWASLVLGAIGGIELLRRRAWATAWFLAAPLLVVVATAAATYGNPRFRITAEVPLLLLAAIGLRTVARFVRRDGGPGDPVSAGTGSAA